MRAWSPRRPAPEAMADYMVKEMDRWGKVVKDIGIKVE